MNTWRGDGPEPKLRLHTLGWVVAGIRALLIGLLIANGLLLLLVLRVIEKPLCGIKRPVTPWITQGVCRLTLFILGLSLQVSGTQMRSPGALVANHSSWLDILVLNSQARLYFVSKHEVSGWAGIGWLARATGTLFIRRKRSEARANEPIPAQPDTSCLDTK